MAFVVSCLYKLMLIFDEKPGEDIMKFIKNFLKKLDIKPIEYLYNYGAIDFFFATVVEYYTNNFCSIF